MPEKKVMSKERRKLIEIIRMNTMLGVLMGLLGSLFITSMFRFIDKMNDIEGYRFLFVIILLIVLFFGLNKLIANQLDYIDEIINE